MSRESAANELIRAQNNARELAQVGRATRQDVERVRDAEKAYTEASKK